MRSDVETDAEASSRYNVLDCIWYNFDWALFPTSVSSSSAPPMDEEKVSGRPVLKLAQSMMF